MSDRDSRDFLYWSTYPLDRSRRFFLHRFRRFLSPLMSNRSLRVCLAACFAIPLILIFSWNLPLWQLLLGPILLGIPHLIGDIRYLVIHKGLHKLSWFWWGVVIPFAMYMLNPQPIFAMLGVCVAAYHSQRTNRGLVLSLAFGGLYLSYIEPYLFVFSLLHAHNIIALWLWWTWRKNRKFWESIPLLLCAISVVCLCFIGPASWAFSFAPPELPHSYFIQNIAPIQLHSYAQELILSYAFLQSVHYLVWLRLIPEDARPQDAPRSFHKSMKYLQRDFGTLILYGSLFSMLLLGFWTVYSPKEARMGYLTIISFHGFLELAFLCYHKKQS